MNALLKQNSKIEQWKSEKKIGPVFYNLLNIIEEKPGLTVGEIYLEYTKHHPRSERARNELAKRVNDLRNRGSVKVSGTATCSLTGRMASRWIVTGVIDVNVPIAAANADRGSTIAVVPTAITSVPAAYTRVLWALHGKCDTIKRFRWLFGKRLAERAQLVQNALECYLTR
jgi:hypothetical protein